MALVLVILKICSAISFCHQQCSKKTLPTEILFTIYMFCRVSQNLLNIIVTVKNRRAKNKPFKTLRQKRSILLFDTDFKYISSLISEPSAAASAITRIRLPLCCSSNFTIPLFPLELIHSRS